MKKYPYKKADAFTEGTSLGNPAAFLVLDESLTDDEYLAIGKEHSGFVCEIVFCLPSEKSCCKLVYYSSECEVSFCGHGTVATMYELIKSDESLMKQSEIEVETNRKGIITVYNHIGDENAVYITAPEKVNLEVKVTKDKIAHALGINEAEISDEFPIDFIDAGLRTLIVPISHFEDEITISPDMNTIKEFCLENDIDIVLAFSKDSSDSSFIAHTRVFSPKFGYLEDPATGSGNSAFGNYMLKNNMWNGEAVKIEQGGKNMEYNTVRLRTTEDGKVMFGGKATLKIDGFYLK